MILDVGCAWNPHGDVNIDVSRARLKGQVKNPIVADVHHLPCRNQAFAIVYSHALLEHISKPTGALKEMMRVARNEVVFVVPHRYFGGKRHPKGHRIFFGTQATREWVRHIVGKLPFLEIEWRGFPSPVLPLLNLPYLIRVRIMLDDDR